MQRINASLSQDTSKRSSKGVMITRNAAELERMLVAQLRVRGDIVNWLLVHYLGLQRDEQLPEERKEGAVIRD